MPTRAPVFKPFRQRPAVRPVPKRPSFCVELTIMMGRTQSINTFAAALAGALWHGTIIRPRGSCCHKKSWFRRALVVKFHQEHAEK